MDATKDLVTVVKALALAALVLVLTLVALWAVDVKPAKPAKPATVTLEIDPVAAKAALEAASAPRPPAPAAFGAEVDQATPAPAAAPAPAAPGCFADLAAQVGWPAEAIPHLTEIIARESTCNPAADTGYRPSTGDWSLGLLQINTLGSLLEARQQACGITAREELLDPATNLRCGLALYNASGFAPWGG